MLTFLKKDQNGDGGSSPRPALLCKTSIGGDADDNDEERIMMMSFLKMIISRYKDGQ